MPSLWQCEQRHQTIHMWKFHEGSIQCHKCGTAETTPYQITCSTTRHPIRKTDMLTPDEKPISHDGLHDSFFRLHELLQDGIWRWNHLPHRHRCFDLSGAPSGAGPLFFTHASDASDGRLVQGGWSSRPVWTEGRDPLWDSPTPLHRWFPKETEHRRRV